MSAPYAKGAPVHVRPPMTPMAQHEGEILGKARYGWRVRFNAWGMMITETMPDSAITPR